MSNDANTGNVGEALTEDQLDQVSGGATLLPDADRTVSGTTEDLMKDSLQRTPKMSDLVSRLNGETEDVQTHFVDTTKG